MSCVVNRFINDIDRTYQVCNYSYDTDWNLIDLMLLKPTGDAHISLSMQVNQRTTKRLLLTELLLIMVK